MSAARDLRLKLGLTQREMADILGIHRSTLNSVERAVRVLTHEEYMKIKALGQLLDTAQPLNDPEVLQRASEVSAGVKRKMTFERAAIPGRLEILRQKQAKMPQQNLQASRAIIILAKEMEIFRDNTAYFMRLEKQYAEALDIYLSTLPEHQQMLNLEITSLEARLEFLTANQNV